MHGEAGGVAGFAKGKADVHFGGITQRRTSSLQVSVAMGGHQDVSPNLRFVTKYVQ
jgi:hypothetical protein